MPSLVFVGLCLVLSKIYMPSGGWVAVRGVQLFGKWFPCALCGASGGSVIIGALRTSRGLMRSFSICFFLLFSLGLRGGWPYEWLVFRIFSLSFPLPSSPLCILLVYQGLRPSVLFYIFYWLFKKKKKRIYKQFRILEGVDLVGWAKFDKEIPS